MAISTNCVKVIQAIYLELLLAMETHCGYSQCKQFGDLLPPLFLADIVRIVFLC